MRYLFAIFLPPLALLLCKKPIQAVLNLILWLVSIPLLFFFGIGVFVWLACSVHALIVCASCSADRRLDRVVAAIESRPKLSVPSHVAE
jgi:uncharacterized membrane protein YqaE (UPF0057 family)